MMHPFIGGLGLLAVAILALISCRDMLRAVPPADESASPETPWLLLFVQAGALGLIFLGFCLLSFGYSPR
jgi:hypothetical protein